MHTHSLPLAQEHSALSPCAKRKSDSFGLLPIEIHPKTLGKWIGCPVYRIHADCIESEVPGTTPIKTFFSHIVSWEVQGKTLRMHLAEPEGILDLKGNVDPEDLSGLLETLILEDRRRNSLRSSVTCDEETMPVFNEMLSWRGTPFVDALDFLLASASRLEANDLHFEPQADRFRVTMRIRGELVETGSYAPTSHAGLTGRLKYLAGCRSHLSGIPQEGAFTLHSGYSSPDAPVVEVRVSVFPSLYGDRVAMRFIRPISFSSLDALGWSKESVHAWRTLLDQGPGLVLIVGPIGCGKTTALYASLAELAKPSENFPDKSSDKSSERSSDKLLSGAKAGVVSRRIATLEDPVEGRVSGICQASLDPKSGLGLADAFKHLLRQDPDIMALGEIRDPASLREALQAGLAGHLVLATFHAADPEGALQRISRMGLERNLSGNGFRGMLLLSLTRQQTASVHRLQPSARVFQIHDGRGDGQPAWEECGSGENHS